MSHTRFDHILSEMEPSPSPRPKAKTDVIEKVVLAATYGSPTADEVVEILERQGIAEEDAWAAMDALTAKGSLRYNRAMQLVGPPLVHERYYNYKGKTYVYSGMSVTGKAIIHPPNEPDMQSSLAVDPCDLEDYGPNWKNPA